jgi:hypothetical protein
MVIDTPAYGVAVPQPFLIAGWALDSATASGTGVDAVHVYAYPSPGSGAAPIFLGPAQLGISRPDVAAYFGAAFTHSGYQLAVRSLAPGYYMLVAFARSTVTGTFGIVRTVNVAVVPSAILTLDAPRPGSAVVNGFLVGGWTIDPAAAAGTGVDTVHVYAYPLETGAPPMFLAAAALTVRRPDVADAFGAQFLQSGFNVTASGLAPGRYRIVAFGRSVVSATFSAVSFADVTVR